MASPTSASSSAETRPLSYPAGGTECIGYLALPEGEGPFPGVLVAPAFSGLSELEKRFANRLAGMGYAALAVDYYGGGTHATSRDEAGRLMQALNGDRPLLASRMEGALAALKALPEVDAGRTAAIGFCFGGKAVLDLARSGADFRAGATFHGIFDAPEGGSQPMKAALLILHGWDDPLAPPQAVTALAEELSTHCEDWQLLGFGNTGHAFTNPAASLPGMGYSESASRRSWAALERFLEEKLA